MHRAAIRLTRNAIASPARGFSSSSAARKLQKYTFPAMSPTMTEGGIAQWKVKEGDSFSAGDVIMEIETDKATMDVETTEDGIMGKIIMGDGSKGIQVGTLVAIIGEEGDDFSGADALINEGGESSSSSSEPAKEAPKEESSSSTSTSGPLTPPSASGPVGTEETPAKAPKIQAEKGERIFASPIAKKLAIEKGIALKDVKGTGPEGRIIKADIDNFKPAAAKAAPAASSSAPAASASASAEYEDIPTSSMRKVIGKRLLESTQNIPTYFVTVEVNMDKTLALRSLFNKAGADGKVKLSVNDFIMKATSLALADVPAANSAWMGESIRQYKKADICVAVATETGLITPIVKDVGGKGLASISAETKALAKKARDGKLKPEEYQGGSFTISNLGMFGVTQFTAIINPPQSCILAVGGTEAKVVSDIEAPSGFKETQVMKVTLTADHRVVDGAVGAQFLAAFRGYIEQPLTMML